MPEYNSSKVNTKTKKTSVGARPSHGGIYGVKNAGNNNAHNGAKPFVPMSLPPQAKPVQAVQPPSQKVKPVQPQPKAKPIQPPSQRVKPVQPQPKAKPIQPPSQRVKSAARPAAKAKTKTKSLPVKSNTLPPKAKPPGQRAIPNNKVNYLNQRGVKRVRKNYIIHITLTAILLVIILSVLSTTIIFNATDVIIKGETGYPNETIMTAGKIGIGTNLIKLKTKQVEDDIIASLVELDTAEIERTAFPPTITVNVKRAEKAFTIYNGKSYLGVSEKRRIISESESCDEGLVILGLSLKNAKLGDFLEPSFFTKKDDEDDEIDEEEYKTMVDKIELAFKLTELVNKNELSEISCIDFSDISDLKIYQGEYNKHNVEIKLGGSDFLGEKIAIASNILANEIMPGEKGILRISNPRKASFYPQM